MSGPSAEHGRALLRGAFDMHVHAAPDVIPRKLDDLELATRAREAGMAGFLLKSHHGSTAERAFLVSKVVLPLAVLGGLVLNDAVGGLNPVAVEIALRLGAKEIWMPTSSARHHRAFFGQPGGLSILAENGRLCAEVEELMRLIGRSDAILGTGHLSGPEVAALVEAAPGAGVRKLVVTHVETHLTRLDAATQRAYARRGVFFERCLLSTTAEAGSVPLAFIAASIREVGAESTVLATDFGQVHNPDPVTGAGELLAGLLGAGVSERDLEVAAHRNPKALLGLA